MNGTSPGVQPDEPGHHEIANALRTVLTLLLQDRVVPKIDIESVTWDRPIFVLRSARMESMESLLRVVLSRRPLPELHIMSHARDESAIRAMINGTFTFYAYPIPGPYRLEGVPPETLARLKAARFGSLFFLDASGTGEGLDEVERILAAIGESGMVSYGADGSFARPEDWRRRRMATEVFYRLIEWYHLKLDPGFPDGPVLPGQAVAALLNRCRV